MSEFISSGVGQVIYNITSSVLYEIVLVTGTFLVVGIIACILFVLFSDREEK